MPLCRKCSNSTRFVHSVTSPEGIFCVSCGDEVPVVDGGTKWAIDSGKEGPVITKEWLKSINIYEHEHVRLPADVGHSFGEFGVRIIGGDDDGQKHSTDQDKDGDEIAELVLVLEKDSTVSCYIETYELPEQGTTALLSIGTRYTRQEVLELAQVLGAWSVPGAWKGVNRDTSGKFRAI